MVDTNQIGDFPALSISPEKVCFIVVKAREFDVEDIEAGPEDNPDESGETAASLFEDRPGDPVADELRGFIDALTEDEQIDLVALSWLGRGDGEIDDWVELRAEAARAHNDRTAAYLLETPLLADYLEEGLAQFGRSCEEFESGRL